ncbi:MAG: DUF6800 family protein [Gemmataceae bacterium]
MVERRKELDKRYQRKKKLAKLKVKLAKAGTPGDRDAVLQKILKISPWWSESASTTGATKPAAAPKKPKAAAPRKKS